MSTNAFQLPLLSDVDLMIRVRDGESEPFELLLRRHRNSLLHFLFHMVHDPAVAEDLAQEVFAVVYRARARYQPSAQFGAWMYRIAKNRAINWVRDNRKHRSSLSLDQLVRPRAGTSATPEQQLLRSERRHQIRRAVDALPERQRVAVLLHKFAEMEYVEIAAVLGCSVSAVKSILNRAYETLRLSLAGF